MGAGTAADAKTLDIYSSLPLQGVNASQTRDAVRGIRLALSEAGGRAGEFDIHYESLDDSTKRAGNWDPSKAAANARRAAKDPLAIFYIGEFNSGASAISIPILNKADIPQVSPSNTYIGLTRRDIGTCCGEPGSYYPTGKRTYVRLAPHDRVQAAALLTTMRQDGCHRTTMADDGELYGLEIAQLARVQAKRLGISVAGYAGNARRGAGPQVAKLAARRHADCFLYGGVTANGAVGIYRAVAGRLPHARLYGGDGVCENGATRPLRQLAARFRCTWSALPVDDYPGGPAFASAFGTEFAGRAPEPYAIQGYEAMKLGLDTIAALGSDGDRREAVRRALLGTHDRSSVLGTYSFDRYGDFTLRDFGVYRATRTGGLAFDRKVVAG
jgi:branched-chain amino acid transport system substrate-binding protein